MVLNRLIITQGDPLRFHLNHTENGEVYQLAEDEIYFLAIAKDENPENAMVCFFNNSQDFEVYLSLEEGSYVFEVGIKNDSGASRVILPSVDERRRALNQLIVLRRLYDV